MPFKDFGDCGRLLSLGVHPCLRSLRHSAIYSPHAAVISEVSSNAVYNTISEVFSSSFLIISLPLSFGAGRLAHTLKAAHLNDPEGPVNECWHRGNLTAGSEL